jgi:hypothetical protein
MKMSLSIIAWFMNWDVYCFCTYPIHIRMSRGARKGASFYIITAAQDMCMYVCAPSTMQSMLKDPQSVRGLPSDVPKSFPPEPENLKF